jgi:hypothetical protein
VSLRAESLSVAEEEHEGDFQSAERSFLTTVAPA